MKQFELNDTTSNREDKNMDGEKSPVNELFGRMRYVRLGNTIVLSLLPNIPRKDPVKELCDRLKVTRFLNRLKLDGMVPVRRLLPTESNVSAVWSPSAAGSGPVSALFTRLNSTNEAIVQLQS